MMTPAPNNRPTTFRQALTRINTLGLVITMVFSWLLITVVSLICFKQYAEKNLQLLGYTLSRNVEAAVVFRDATAANEALSSLGKQGQFSSAMLTDARGKTLAQWHDEESQNDARLDYRVSQWLFAGNVIQPIIHRGQLIGYLNIRGADTPARNFVLFSLLSLTLCMLLASLLSIVISRRLHRGLILSLHNITEVVHDIRENRHFSRRVPAVSVAELDRFGRDLNSLLDEIERWQRQMQHENDSLLKRSLHDPLTGLANRTAFSSALASLLQDPDYQASTSLLFMDGYRFKNINDTYGHAAGDQVLLTVASRLSHCAGKQDLPARLAGDEFALILVGKKDTHEVQQTVDAIRHAMQQPVILPEGQQVVMSLSIGVAHASSQTTPQSLIEQADKAMYQDKQQQRRRDFERVLRYLDADIAVKQ
ncbi:MULTISPECIES: diguanylate cyclase domain-containing protein [Dickeya]|uniref:Diguanylate cyclase/phosphodiesterase (GGDEF & EAL domains) with PAS/PAC sensor(S) n=1 Tax=Dickeya aquatica TaxID=1401087 RepID=A0A375AF76_9GAMM|nr:MULTISPECIES: diguanylate cyclase [Dickeya]SLM64259.1 diguanylate cyclase/phosphodiesterase (GGDEF & EAL domains) with PAS/PAC sensor(s) [Dickeya aquatica]